MERPVALNHRERSRIGFREGAPTPMYQAKENALFNQMFDRYRSQEKIDKFAGRSHGDTFRSYTRTNMISLYHQMKADQRDKAKN